MEFIFETLLQKYNNIILILLLILHLLRITFLKLIQFDMKWKYFIMILFIDEHISI